jgi:DNA-binding SARP family transcriptional activator
MGSTGVIYRLLGELEIGEDGRLVGLPTGPTLILLAVLLVNANRTMSKSDLIRAAWGRGCPRLRSRAPTRRCG